jgi:hypothetical protein
MPRQTFDRVMIDVGIGRHVKLRHLSDAERWCFVAGVLPIAADAPVRGFLLVGNEPATPEAVAFVAGSRASVARSSLSKLRAASVLIPNSDLGCEEVHDFEEWNPPPRRDKTAADRARRYRERRAQQQRHGVTDRDVTRDVTAPNAPEVEGKGREEVTTSLVEPSRLDDAAFIRQVFDRWRERCNHPQAKLTADRRAKVKARIREGRTLEDFFAAIEGAARAAFVNDEGKRFDDLELICRSGAKFESFMARAVSQPPNPNRPSTKQERMARGVAALDRLKGAA